MSQETVCSLCTTLLQLYDDSKKFGINADFELPSLEFKILEHLQVEHGVKKWEPIPA